MEINWRWFLVNELTKILGTVAMEPKGEYDSSAYYEKLNVVTYEGSSYVATQPSNNVLPTDTDYWQFIGGGVKYMHGETEDRPTDNLVIGQMFFDTTLGKPIWYDGTNWVDATGTSVEE